MIITLTLNKIKFFFASNFIRTLKDTKSAKINISEYKSPTTANEIFMKKKNLIIEKLTKLKITQTIKTPVNIRILN